MADAFRITQEIEFFDVDNYEERAATYETLHSAAERSMRDDTVRRAVVLMGAAGFLGLFWNVVGGPGAEAQASSAAVITAPFEVPEDAANAAVPVVAPSPVAPTPAAAVHVVTGPTPWGVAKGFDVLTPAAELPVAVAVELVEEELLVAELSDNLLSRLTTAAAPPPPPPAVKRTPPPIARSSVRPARRIATPPMAARPSHDRPAKVSRSATLELAVTLHDEGHSDEALKQLRKLGAHPEALVLKGSIYQDKADPVAAREVYESYLKRYPRGGHAATVRSILRRL